MACQRLALIVSSRNISAGVNRIGRIVDSGIKGIASRMHRPAQENRMEIQKEQNRCAHANCTCAIPDEDVYCSDACRIAEQTTINPMDMTTAEARSCHCGHPGCRG